MLYSTSKADFYYRPNDCKEYGSVYQLNPYQPVYGSIDSLVDREVPPELYDMLFELFVRKGTTLLTKP